MASLLLILSADTRRLVSTNLWNEKTNEIATLSREVFKGKPPNN
jgi:hypothetical protein